MEAEVHSAKTSTVEQSNHSYLKHLPPEVVVLFLHSVCVVDNIPFHVTLKEGLSSLDMKFSNTVQ